MKIGILTFHWATNYGAVLQAYCLQQFLIGQGYDVSIINYKPRQYDFSWYDYIRNPKRVKHIHRDISTYKKEKMLASFRSKYLSITRRYFSIDELYDDINKFDILISGSDQVLNPSFTIRGEDGRPSPAYWLSFGRRNTKRLGYAVSFGCEQYPDIAVPVAKEWVNWFDAIGVRETTGLKILEQLGYKGPKEVLPDPTLLLGKELFSKLGIEIPSTRKDYICVYMLRKEIIVKGNVQYIDEKHHPLAIEQWLQTIANANKVVTNSYHGMIMAILAHVPFAVLLETGSDSGMNDRFNTLLEKLGVKERLTTTLEDAMLVLQHPVDFKKLDEAIIQYRIVGENYFRDNIHF